MSNLLGSCILLKILLGFPTGSCDCPGLSIAAISEVGTPSPTRASTSRGSIRPTSTSGGNTLSSPKEMPSVTTALLRSTTKRVLSRCGREGSSPQQGKSSGSSCCPNVWCCSANFPITKFRLIYWRCLNSSKDSSQSYRIRSIRTYTASFCSWTTREGTRNGKI